MTTTDVPPSFIDEFIGGGLEPVHPHTVMGSDQLEYQRSLGPSRNFMWPFPRPKIVALVWCHEISQPIEVTYDLLLVLDEGVYLGDINGAYYKAYFVPWDDVMSSTIPLSDLRSGHPPA